MLLWDARHLLQGAHRRRGIGAGAARVVLAAALLVASCRDGDGGVVIVVPGPLPTATATATPAPTPTASPGIGQVRIAFAFQQGLQDWRPVFADYQAEQEREFEFHAGYAAVPPDLSGRSGLLLSSVNRSADVFMGVYRRVDGLRPNTAYRVEATLSLASNAGAGCAGIGGSPGEGVHVKAGGSGVVPQPNERGFVRLPIDKGDQAGSGRDMTVIGDLATAENAGCDPARARYVRKTIATDGRAPIVRSDGEGRLWLVMGTDSGYEGRTTIYLLEGAFVLTPA